MERFNLFHFSPHRCDKTENEIDKNKIELKRFYLQSDVEIQSKFFRRKKIVELDVWLMVYIKTNNNLRPILIATNNLLLKQNSDNRSTELRFT